MEMPSILDKVRGDFRSAYIVAAASIIAYTILGVEGLAQVSGYYLGVSAAVLASAIGFPEAGFYLMALVLAGMALPGVAATLLPSHPRASAALSVLYLASTPLLALYVLASQGRSEVLLAVATAIQVAIILAGSIVVAGGVGYRSLTLAAILMAIASPLPAALKLAVMGPVGDTPWELIAVIQSIAASIGLAVAALQLGEPKIALAGGGVAAWGLLVLGAAVAGEVSDAEALVLYLPPSLAAIAASIAAVAR